MIVKFFKHGKSQKRPTKSAQQAVNYVTGMKAWNKEENRLESRSVAPETIRGDAGVWSEIVGHGNHAGRYTSGVLRFAESEVEEKTQQEIISDFEKALIPGLEADQYSSLWVRHEDKGSVELHFMFAGEELSSGKRLNAYYHNADKPRIDAWKNAINAEYDFADPNDPSRRQQLTKASNLPKERKELIETIDQHIEKMVGDGVLNNRKEIMEELEKLKLEVSRETEKSISIKNPNGGQNVRLKGFLYERSFSSNQFSTERREEKAQEYSERRGERAKKSRELFNRMYEKRSELNREKYKKIVNDEDLHSDYSNSNIVDFRDFRGSSRNLISTKQDNSRSLSRGPELHSMRKDSRNTKKPEAMQATIKENKNEPNEKRNERVFEEFWERIRRKRKEIAFTAQRTVSVFRKNGDRARENTRVVDDSIGKLRESNEEVRRNRRRECGIKNDFGKIRKSIVKLERNKKKRERKNNDLSL